MIATEMTEPTLSGSDFARVRALAARHAGIQVSAGRERLVHSRLARRLRALRLRTFAAYCDRLEAGDRRELTHFVGAITTHVTSFFREQHHFDYLRDEIVPRWRRRSSSGPLRVFSAACSTGQEPYSIAMTLREAARGAAPVQTQILGWDIDRASVETARRGVYRAELVRDMRTPLMNRYFQRGTGVQNGLVKIKPRLRDCMSFRVGNIREVGESTGQFDVIFCRNVLIYFSSEAARATCHRLAARLTPGGHLFLGHAETARELKMLEPVAPTVYRKKGP